MYFDQVCSYYHGHINIQETSAILRSQTVGSYLLRMCGLDPVISYKDKNEDIKHVIVSNKKDNSLMKSFPNLKTLDDVCSKILSVGITFLEGIERTTPSPANNCVVTSSLVCQICLQTFDSEYKVRTHKKAHKLCFCDRKWSTKRK